MKVYPINAAASRTSSGQQFVRRGRTSQVDLCVFQMAPLSKLPVLMMVQNCKHEAPVWMNPASDSVKKSTSQLLNVVPYNKYNCLWDGHSGQQARTRSGRCASQAVVWKVATWSADVRSHPRSFFFFFLTICVSINTFISASLKTWPNTHDFCCVFCCVAFCLMSSTGDFSSSCSLFCENQTTNGLCIYLDQMKHPAAELRLSLPNFLRQPPSPKCILTPALTAAAQTKKESAPI